MLMRVCMCIHMAYAYVHVCSRVHMQRSRPTSGSGFSLHHVAFRDCIHVVRFGSVPSAAELSH